MVQESACKFVFCLFCLSLEYSLLDCIFHEASRTFYILDIMCWRGHPVYDSDTEFRFFWLHSKVADVPILTKSSSTNPVSMLEVADVYDL